MNDHAPAEVRRAIAESIATVRRVAAALNLDLSDVVEARRLPPGGDDAMLEDRDPAPPSGSSGGAAVVPA
ncbi:hypothetical protein [Rhizobium leguminosarum]|uniref:hypothetical protein n=1 Tax=Rhizobium leguminosarum TaxID=384 RepID=UPI002E1183DA|nr:hypothetical protein U8Q02_37465 [Rhizobium leguminosarum]